MAIFDWVGKPSKAHTIDLDPEIARLADVFHSVRSMEDCLSLLHNQDLLGVAGPNEATCKILEGICSYLRTQGLGLEPNLIGRATATAVMEHLLAGAASTAFAAKDPDFQDRVAEADSARDRGDFGEAEYRYWLALQYFPSHPGCLVQYGHSLKEQNKQSSALISYLNAHVFGAPIRDVEPHALFVAERLGRYDQVSKIFRKPRSVNPIGPDDSMAQMLSSRDVVTLTQLLHERTPNSDEILKRMCDHANRRELTLSLIDEKDFFIAHRDLLRLVNETGWGIK